MYGFYYYYLILYSISTTITIFYYYFYTITHMLLLLLLFYYSYTISSIKQCFPLRHWSVFNSSHSGISSSLVMGSCNFPHWALLCHFFFSKSLSLWRKNTFDFFLLLLLLLLDSFQKTHPYSPPASSSPVLRLQIL